MRNTKFGGAVEYLALLLLVLQIVVGRVWLIRRRASWPRTAWIATTTGLVVLWGITLGAIALTWSGAMYSSRDIPVDLRVGVVEVGYFWILLSSLGGGSGFVWRFLTTGIPGTHSGSRRNLLRAGSLLAVAAPSTLVAYGVFVERNRFGVAELDLPVPGLHPDLEGFRIVQVSDLHVSPFLSPRQAARAIDMANELRGDLALFTGDLISEPGDPLDEAIRELIRLRGNEGVLGCMGNHEEYVGCRRYLAQKAAEAGVIFLRRAATQIHRGEATLNIVGVDYQRNANRADYLRGSERFIVPGATNLLLSHNPDVFPTAIQRGFQAVLSGHTHGGQINVEILHQNVNPARFRTPFTSGLYRQAPGKTPGSCFVTNGIGTIGMPIRLGAPPQIAHLRLRRA